MSGASVSVVRATLFACGFAASIACAETPPASPTAPGTQDQAALARPLQGTPREKVIAFLQRVSGRWVISGQHNREPSSQPTLWTDAIHKTTGRYPALWSGDFLFQQENIAARAVMVQEARAQWQRGAVVNIMWHACPPEQGEPCEWEGGVLSRMSDAKWNELIEDGTPLNRVWKSRLHGIARSLLELQAAGVAVLWRPFHEMNQGKFWWGGRTGPRGTARLYQLSRDYLEREKGLTNLVWVWDVQDLDWTWAAYDPGASYWDVLALDVYDGDGYTRREYDTLLALAGDKPIAIGECEKLPTPAELAAQPRWAFFMPWAELVYKGQDEAQIRALYADPRVVTLDEMPGWN
jgi:mannan endo-1,4-beta-mannosidase